MRPPQASHRVTSTWNTRASRRAHVRRWRRRGASVSSPPGPPAFRLALQDSAPATRCRLATACWYCWSRGRLARRGTDGCDGPAAGSPYPPQGSDFYHWRKLRKDVRHYDNASSDCPCRAVAAGSTASLGSVVARGGVNGCPELNSPGALDQLAEAACGPGRVQAAAVRGPRHLGHVDVTAGVHS